MRREGMTLTVVVLGCAGSVLAAPTIPADRRIEAKIVGTLTGPSDRPMRMPTDVAVDRTGRVYVADGTHDRVVRFTADGNVAGVIAKVGEQTLNRPVGLTTDGRDRLWIADTGNHRLVVVTPDGSQIETIALPEAARPCDPTDVLVAPDGRRAYVVDNDNHRLLVRTAVDGRVDVLGDAGRGLGQFQWPFMICSGRDGDVFVSEAIGARVQRLNAQDRWVGQVGWWGAELGQLYRPKGIAADGAGRLFVGDSTLGVVQVFSPRGSVVGVLTNPDGTPLYFDHPMGLSFDSRGRLYVVELRAHRVAIVAVASPSRPSADDAGKGDGR